MTQDDPDSLIDLDAFDVSVLDAEDAALRGMPRTVTDTAARASRRGRIVAWIEEAMRLTGWTASRLSASAGLAKSTVTRFLREPTGPMLSATTLDCLHEAVGREVEARRLGSIRHPLADVGARTAPLVVALTGADGIDWTVPSAFAARLSSSIATLSVVPISGDASEPHCSDGDYVVVDLNRTAVGAGGLFLVDHGSAPLVMRLDPGGGEGMNVIGRVAGSLRRALFR